MVHGAALIFSLDRISGCVKTANVGEGLITELGWDAMRLKPLSRTLALTATLVASSAALPAFADDILVYDVDPGTGPAAIASGTFTFDETSNTIISWDISVVDGGTTTLFENGTGKSSTYGFAATAWDAHFSDGGSTYLDFYFANPGLGAITSGPATVPLLSKSVEKVGGVGAQIDNPSVSVVPEAGTLALLLVGLGLGGIALRRRSGADGALSSV